jgi:hypothetical protein
MAAEGVCFSLYMATTFNIKCTKPLTNFELHWADNVLGSLVRIWILLGSQCEINSLQKLTPSYPANSLLRVRRLGVCGNICSFRDVLRSHAFWTTYLQILNVWPVKK